MTRMNVTEEQAMHKIYISYIAREKNFHLSKCGKSVRHIAQFQTFPLARELDLYGTL